MQEIRFKLLGILSFRDLDFLRDILPIKVIRFIKSWTWNLGFSRKKRTLTAKFKKLLFRTYKVNCRILRTSFYILCFFAKMLEMWRLYIPLSSIFDEANFKNQSMPSVIFEDRSYNRRMVYYSWSKDTCFRLKDSKTLSYNRTVLKPSIWKYDYGFNRNNVAIFTVEIMQIDNETLDLCWWRRSEVREGRMWSVANIWWLKSIYILIYLSVDVWYDVLYHSFGINNTNK